MMRKELTAAAAVSGSFEAAEIDTLMSHHLDSEREPRDAMQKVEAKAII